MSGKSTINITNRRAGHEFHLLHKYVAGLVLKGTEIKSIREGNVNLSDGFCFIKDGELFVRNIHIGSYSHGTHENHEPMRVRKLLLKKTEIRKISSKLKEQGNTLVPLRLFISETGYAKLEIALAKGKRDFDKREDIKKRDIDREIRRYSG